MQFCDNCGAILDLFQYSDRMLCENCETVDDTGAQTTNQPTKEEIGEYNFLPEGTALRVERGKIHIIAPNGICLWSGTAEYSHDLDFALQKAKKIYDVRQKHGEHLEHLERSL